ncbi:UAP56-interacting factor [Neoarius graeffei]|uniref:UAP56-interacting factor n=1 Tax=Neoarius graeffei TaxID=443677 RepID=UPI00298C7C76|nr:UAP56-interacting factor [Neoarius graeffei]
MGDSEFSEPMDESQADKIDMSLDEIIKLNKKEEKANRARNRHVTNRNNVLKKLNQTPQARRGLRRGSLQYQGPSRSRGLNRSRGLGRQSGLSPLNRANTKTGEQQVQTTASVRGSFRGRGRGRGRGPGGLSRGALSATGQRVPQRGGRPLVLDGRFPAMRGTGKLERYQKIRSQRTTSAPGTTLTVSLPNAKSPPVTQARPQRGGTALRGRSSEVVSRKPTPKGIPLHFNYKATTNQTRLSLNERFTGLRMRGRGPRLNRESGKGRGRGRGEICGGRGVIKEAPAITRGGRGRARGGARGSGRTVFLQ